MNSLIILFPTIFLSKTTQFLLKPESILPKKKTVYDRRTLKIQMGYKMCTPGVQVFPGYEKAKWGIVPPNGVHMAALSAII
jgi:hypothetical protein